MIGNCIKTGAIVDFYEWGTATPCDLYEVGDSVVIRFFAGKFYTDDHHHRPVTHKALIGTEGYLDKANGFACVPKADIETLWGGS